MPQSFIFQITLMSLFIRSRRGPWLIPRIKSWTWTSFFRRPEKGTCAAISSSLSFNQELPSGFLSRNSLMEYRGRCVFNKSAVCIRAGERGESGSNRGRDAAQWVSSKGNRTPPIWQSVEALGEPWTKWKRGGEGEMVKLPPPNSGSFRLWPSVIPLPGQLER